MSPLPPPRPAYDPSEVSHTIPLLPLYSFLQSLYSERDTARLKDVLVKHRTTESYERVDERLMESVEVVEGEERVEYVWGPPEESSGEGERGEAPREDTGNAGEAGANAPAPADKTGDTDRAEPARQDDDNAPGPSGSIRDGSILPEPSNSEPRESLDVPAPAPPTEAPTESAAGLAPPPPQEGAVEALDSVAIPAQFQTADDLDAAPLKVELDKPASVVSHQPEIAAEPRNSDGFSAPPKPVVDDPNLQDPAQPDSVVEEPSTLMLLSHPEIREESLGPANPSDLKSTVQEPTVEGPAPSESLPRPAANPVFSTTTPPPPPTTEPLAELPPDSGPSNSGAAPQPAVPPAPPSGPPPASPYDPPISASSTLPLLPPRRYCQEVRLDLRTLSAPAIFALESWRRERLGIEGLVLESIKFGRAALNGVRAGKGKGKGAEDEEEEEEEEEDEFFYSVEMEEAAMNEPSKVWKGKGKAVDQNESREDGSGEDELEQSPPLFFSPEAGGAGPNGEPLSPGDPYAPRISASDADALFFSAEMEEAEVNGEPWLWGGKAKASAMPPPASGMNTEEDTRPARRTKGAPLFFPRSSDEDPSDIGALLPGGTMPSIMETSESATGELGHSQGAPVVKRRVGRPRKSETPVQKPKRGRPRKSDPDSWVPGLPVGSLPDPSRPKRSRPPVSGIASAVPKLPLGALPNPLQSSTGEEAISLSRKPGRPRKIAPRPSDTDDMPVPSSHPVGLGKPKPSTSKLQPHPKVTIPTPVAYPKSFTDSSLSPPPTLAAAMAADPFAPTAGPSASSRPHQTQSRAGDARRRRYANENDLESEEEMSVPLAKRQRRTSEVVPRKEKKGVGRPRKTLPRESTTGVAVVPPSSALVKDKRKAGRPPKVKRGGKRVRSAVTSTEATARGKRAGPARKKRLRRVMVCVELPLRPPPRMVVKKSLQYPRAGGGVPMHDRTSRDIAPLPRRTQGNGGPGVADVEESEEVDQLGETETELEGDTSWYTESASGGLGKLGERSGSRGGVVRYGKKGQRTTEWETEAKKRAEKRDRELAREHERTRVVADGAKAKHGSLVKRKRRMVMEAVVLPMRKKGEKGVGGKGQKQARLSSWGIGGETGEEQEDGG